MAIPKSKIHSPVNRQNHIEDHIYYHYMNSDLQQTSDRSQPLNHG